MKPEDLELDICVDLASAGRQEDVCPSIELHSTEMGAKVQVTHQLRLVMQPLHGAEAWNTMPVRLARTTPRGSPRGTLHVAAPEKLSNKELAILAMKEVLARRHLCQRPLHHTHPTRRR